MTRTLNLTPVASAQSPLTEWFTLQTDACLPDSPAVIAHGAHLPFPAETFDALTLRQPRFTTLDPYRLLLDCRRVLRAGGEVTIEAIAAPDAERAGQYLDAVYRLHTPWHHRLYAPTFWQGTLLDVGLEIGALVMEETYLHLPTWAAAGNCGDYELTRLHVLLAGAPAKVQAWVQPRCTGSPAETEFREVRFRLTGRRPTHE